MEDWAQGVEGVLDRDKPARASILVDQAQRLLLRIQYDGGCLEVDLGVRAQSVTLESQALVIVDRVKLHSFVPQNIALLGALNDLVLRFRVVALSPGDENESIFQLIELYNRDPEFRGIFARETGVMFL
jgi:hypothetical protein